MELRAPYDVANLYPNVLMHSSNSLTDGSCHLFGLKGGGQCKALVTTNCELTILHAGELM